MKKLLTLALAVVLLLGVTACGAINDTEVAVLWSGDGVVHVPDSLINALDRAMYIESIRYAHYGANGDQAAQTAQVQQVLDQGCSGLVVELVDVSAAQSIVDLAKAKNVPLVFVNSEVDAAVVSSYDKCAVVMTDEASVVKVLGDKVAESFAKEKDYDKADLNKDGKITYLPLGDVTAIVDEINAQLKEAGRNAIEAVKATSMEELTVATVKEGKTEYGRLTDKEGNVVELILSDNDVKMLSDLVALQAKEFNANKLKTHFVPAYTVGADADYKAYLFEQIPEVGAVLKDGKLSDEKADESIPAEVIDEIRSYANLVKFATLEKWSDLNKAVYTTRNVIADGHLSNAATEDLDGLAGAVAQTMANLIKGTALDKNCVEVAYTIVA